MHFLLALTLSETKKNKCSAKCKMCKIDFVVDISPTQGTGKLNSSGSSPSSAAVFFFQDSDMAFDTPYAIQKL